jgi:hypothetical protein
MCICRWKRDPNSIVLRRRRSTARNGTTFARGMSGCAGAFSPTSIAHGRSSATTKLQRGQAMAKHKEEAYRFPRHRPRWVYVADVIGEFEINFRDEPVHCPALRVEIVGMRHNQIVERTWTYNKKYRRGGATPEFHSTQPPGRLWKFEKDDGQSTSWMRRRDRTVALVWREVTSVGGVRRSADSKNAGS